MKHPIVVLFLAVFTLAAGCRSYAGQYYVGADDYVLASRSGPEGRKETYRLDVRGDGSLRIQRESLRDRPALGLKAIEVDKEQAERRGVKPYCGLLVTAVAPKSSAAEAGVLVGDVLLALGGKETVYLPQITAIEATLRDGQTVVAKVLRGQDQMDLSLVTQREKELVTEQEVVPLEVPETSQRPYAGVTLRGIPAAVCEQVFGVKREAVVVTNVEVGSPAWVAGIRGGDVIEMVDGAPVPNVHELSRRIVANGQLEKPMTMVVRHGPGPAHEGKVELSDYSEDSHAWIPLVFCLENGTYSDRWSIGPFGLVLSNRNHYVADSSTRRVQTRNVFSALLGLFRVETSPEETEVRLLWLIRFDT